MSDARVVLITHPEDGAGEFARALVERRLAGCVHLVGVRSVYRWQGEVREDPEVLLVCKTRADCVAPLERHVASEHPYDVPECVALEPASVEARYLAWLVAQAEPGAP